MQKPGEELDAAIDAFLQTHPGQPVTRGLRRDWLTSLAQRRRWDRFLALSGDVTEPLLACDRLQGRLATGDTEDSAPRRSRAGACRRSSRLNAMTCLSGCGSKIC